MDEPCLEPDTVIDLVCGRLPTEARTDAERHLDRCDECRVAVADLAASAGADPAGLADSARALPALGERYELFERLGRGGMGVVHRAVPVGGGPPVALKWLPAGVQDGETRRRFAREAEIARTLVHPNVVRLRDHGIAPDGAPFIAMELLAGEDLGRRLRRGPLTVQETVRVGCDAAAGLGAAHRAGVVHRDVKPGNLFLCDDGTVKVLDFGLAVPTDADAERFTRTAAVVGTPAFMSYEQAGGKQREDARTDVWGLGATLYRAVSGHVPFRAETALAMLVRITTDEPDPLPDHIPRWLATILLRALRREKAERWQTAEELADALATGLREASGVDAAETTTRSQKQPGLVPLAAEVRLVSVLVAEELGDSAVFDSVVRAFGGAVTPLVGRRAVGIFGGQRWAGDEAERAVRAALELRRRGAGGLLGVGTGRAERMSSGRVAGSAVGAAESVLDRVAVGADDETRRRVRGGFDLDGARIVRVRPGATIVGVRGVAGADLPLVGRDRELADLEATVRQIAGEGQAAGVLVVGAPGIGKSRLLHALAARVEAAELGVRRVEARCEASRQMEGWHALAGAVRLLADVPAGLDAAVARERLRAIAPTEAGAEVLGELVDCGFDPSPELVAARADPVLLHDRIGDAIVEMIEALAETAPVLVLVEDLHWADDPSRALVESLPRRLEDRRVLVVATSRPEPSGLAPGFRPLALTGVSRAATRAIVAAILGPISDERADAVHARTGGNPYFSEELALALRDGLDDLPSSVEEAVQVRLDALPRAEKDLLRRASVFGERFWAQALSDLREEGALPLLESLRRRELVEPERRSRLAGMSEWRFRHAVTREVAYRTLTEEQCRQLHRAAALWLAERPDAPALELAWHLEQGGDSGSALSHWARGAELALGEGNFGAGLRASERALERIDDVAEKFRLRLLRAAAFFHLGQLDDERRELADARPLAETPAARLMWWERAAYLDWRRGAPEAVLATTAEGLAEAPESGRLLMRRAAALRDLGRYDEALDVSERAISVAGGDGYVLGGALVTMSYCRSRAGAVDAALELVDRAIAAYATTGDVRLGFIPRCTRGLLLLSAGRAADASREMGVLRAECRRAVHRFSEAYLLSVLGLAQARLGDVDAGTRTLAAGLALAGEVEAPRIELQCLEFQGAALVEAGRPAEALAPLDRARTLLPESPAFQAEIEALRALALADMGRLDEARETAERGLALRDAAGGMEDFEADLFVAAHAAGIPGALERGLDALDHRMAAIVDPAVRETFIRGVPGNARLTGIRVGSAV